MNKYALFLLLLATLPSIADPISSETAARHAYRNPGPVAIAGYRAPSPPTDQKTISRLNLQNANPYDFYLPCYYGGWCFFGPYQTPYGLIQSSGSLPW